MQILNLAPSYRATVYLGVQFYYGSLGHSEAVHADDLRACNSVRRANLSSIGPLLGINSLKHRHPVWVSNMRTLIVIPACLQGHCL